MPFRIYFASSRCNDISEAPLCYFAFKDGRHCAMRIPTMTVCATPMALSLAALPAMLAPIVAGRCGVKARQQALSRASAARRLSPEWTRMLTQISLLIEQNARLPTEHRSS